jgi:hypothetical protein
MPISLHQQSGNRNLIIENGYLKITLFSNFYCALKSYALSFSKNINLQNIKCLFSK